MLKISRLFKKFTNFTANNSRIRRIKNAKLSEYCFYMNTDIYGDFQICISVPLTQFFLQIYLQYNIIFSLCIIFTSFLFLASYSHQLKISHNITIKLK